MTPLLVWSDRFFELPAPLLGAIWLAGAALACRLAYRRQGGARGRRAPWVAAGLVVGMTIAGFAYYKVFQRVTGKLGRHLPDVTLLAPTAEQEVGARIALRAHATDRPGALGPVAAVRSIEFWLYHPSFAEQHPGNRESKVLLGAVDGPRSDDIYETSWTCSNPFTPMRDGDHSGGDGTRTYRLPDDARPYSVQAHGLDDEWRAKPGRPGRSERVTVRFDPCE